MSIKIDISVGELLDKITILQIKTERITDPEKLVNINKELVILSEHWENSEYDPRPLEQYIDDLKKINEKLWDIEDAIRDKERQQLFDETFVELARSVYFCNDQRAKIKHSINDKTGSELVEEKSYQEYSDSNNQS